MKRRAYTLPLKYRLSRRMIQWFFRLILWMLARVRVEGMEKIPKRGSYLIVFNHVSIYDPPVLGAYLPVAPEVLGAIDIWSRPGQDVLARLYGGIPIRRGEVDRQAMERMLAALSSGYPLMVAPEGTRSHEPGMQTAKPGVVYVIEKVGVPVIPVGITGTTDRFMTNALKFQRPIVKIRVGEPFMMPDLSPDGLPPREVRQLKADYIMRKIAELLPPEYRGVYGP